MINSETLLFPHLGSQNTESQEFTPGSGNSQTLNSEQPSPRGKDLKKFLPTETQPGDTTERHERNR